MNRNTNIHVSPRVVLEGFPFNLSCSYSLQFQSKPCRVTDAVAPSQPGWRWDPFPLVWIRVRLRLRTSCFIPIPLTRKSRWCHWWWCLDRRCFFWNHGAWGCPTFSEGTGGICTGDMCSRRTWRIFTSGNQTWTWAWIQGWTLATAGCFWQQTKGSGGGSLHWILSTLSLTVETAWETDLKLTYFWDMR